MYKEFCITDISLSLPNKTITLKANFKIEEKSVNLNTVKLKDSKTGQLEDYTLEVKGYRIIITFRDWPKQNHEYSITVSNEIADKLERSLNSSFTKTVMFESQVKYKANIVEPNPSETIKGNDTTIKITVTPEEDAVKEYNYQIASDSAFCDIVHDFKTDELEALFSFDEDKQYFARVRVLEGDAIGEWSPVVDFVMIDTNKDNECEEDCCCDKNTKDELSPFLEDMLSMDPVLMDIKPLEIISVEPNGKTSDQMLIYFNQDLEEVPNHLLMLRRDL